MGQPYAGPARDPLARALELAARCGARPLAAQARDELKAIEGHLARAYAKLGIDSRDQLPQALGSRKD